MDELCRSFTRLVQKPPVLWLVLRLVLRLVLLSSGHRTGHPRGAGGPPHLQRLPGLGHGGGPRAHPTVPEHHLSEPQDSCLLPAAPEGWVLHGVPVLPWCKGSWRQGSWQQGGWRQVSWHERCQGTLRPQLAARLLVPRQPAAGQLVPRQPAAGQLVPRHSHAMWCQGIWHNQHLERWVGSKYG
jgi:hypothetical protein